MKKIALILFIILIFIPGCAYSIRYDGPYRGRIIDEDTREPIEGVVVLGVWYTEIPTVAGPKHDYFDAREIVTDKNGEFEIQGKGLRILSRLQPIRVTIFKAGYGYRGLFWKPGHVPYRSKIKWEDDMAIIPLRKLTMEERRRKGSPSRPPDEAPLEKVIHMLKEIDKNEIELGLKPYGIWKGEKYE